MRKKHINLLLVSAALCLGSVATLASCGETEPEVPGPVDPDKPNPDKPEVEIKSISFAEPTYEVKNGDAVTIKENVKGVKYTLLEAIDGITLDENTGKFSFDDTKDSYPDGMLVATYNDLTATTIVTFKTTPALPTVTFTNASDYLVSGEHATARAITPDGTLKGVSYGLKVEVAGITVNAENGRVEYGPDVADGTKFIVTATSKTVVVEREFIALTENIVKSATDKFIVETTDLIDAKFTLDFNGNVEGDAETTAENVTLFVNGAEVEDKTMFAYDATTKEVTIKKELIGTLSSGEIDVKVGTKRNAVALNLVIADAIIYDALQFNDIFTPDYSAYIADPETGIPTFNEEALEGYYVLGDDVDLTPIYELDQYKRYGFLPVGMESEGKFSIPFKGTFDGNGHTISNYWVNHDDAHFWNAGLFGTSSGTIKNFTITGKTLAMKSWSGIIAGKNTGTIENIISNVNVASGADIPATGLVGVNEGTLRHIINLHTDIAGCAEGKKGGLIVGLNGGAGVVEECYAIKSTSGAPALTLMGSTLNPNMKEAEVGKIYDTIDALKAAEEIKLGEGFTKATGELPVLKEGFTSPVVGLFKAESSKDVALKGDKFDVNLTILPRKYAEELATKVTYTIPEEKGIVIENNKIDLTNLTNIAEAGEDITITAKVEYNGKALESTFTFKAYSALNSLTFVNLPEKVLAGETYDLTLMSDPELALSGVKYEVTTDGSGWQVGAGYIASFMKLDAANGTLKLDDYLSRCTTVNNVTVKASVLGKTVEKTMPLLPIRGLAGVNTQVKYEGETTDFSFAVGANPVTAVTLDGEALTTEQYTNAEGYLNIKRDLVADFEVEHVLTITTENGTNYRAYAVATKDVKRDATWVAANDPEAIHIATVEDFKTYFDVKGGTLDKAHKDNLYKHYILDADLDFAAETGLQPVTANGAGDALTFRGVIYGNGHTIKNYKMNFAGGSWKNGIFSNLAGDVYDLTLDTCTNEATGGNFGGILAGIGDGEKMPNIVNVHAVNCKVQNGDNGDTFATPDMFVSGLIGRTWGGAAGVAKIHFSTFNGFNTHITRY